MELSKKKKLLIVLFLIIIYIYNCRGINMKCPLCFKNGYHLHLGDFIINTNHGPKKNGRFEHSPCKICKKKAGDLHFHLCMPTFN